MRLAKSLRHKTPDAMSVVPSAMVSRHSTTDIIGHALNGSDNIVLVLEEDGKALRITAANEEAERATGFSVEQLVGQPLTMLFEKVESESTAAINAAVREGRAQRAQLRCVTRTGQLFWFGLHILPADKPAAGRYVVLGHDITAKLRQEAQAEAVQSLLAKVFVTVDAAVYITDAQGYLVMTNPAFDRLIGVPAGTFVGRQAVELFAPASRQAVTKAREKQVADEVDYSLDVVLRIRNDQEVAGSISVAMVQRADLNRFRVVTIRTKVSPASDPVIAGRKAAYAGRIQLIGLEEVRESLGPQWAALRERALTTAESVLSRRLGQQDTFSRTEDAGYVVCFANASEQEAVSRSAAIGSEIRQILIGNGESPELAHVFSTAVAVPPDKEDLSAAKFAEMVKQRVNERLRIIQETARANLARALENTPYDTETIYARGVATPTGWRICFNSATRRALEIAVGALPAAEMTTFDPDVMLLHFAHECLVERALQSPGSLVFVTLSADILLVRKRMDAFLKACQAVAENQRKQLVLAVTAPEAAVSRQINNGLPRLRSFCRSLGITVDRLDIRDLDLREAGLAFVLVDSNTLSGSKKIKDWVSGLQSQRCQLMVTSADIGDVPSLLRDAASFVSVSKAPKN